VKNHVLRQELSELRRIGTAAVPQSAQRMQESSRLLGLVM
jgi:hypothetical protein